VTSDTALEKLLSLWEAHRAAGRDLPADQLCPDRPDLADELARRIDVLRQVNHVAQAVPRTTRFEKVESVCQAFTTNWETDGKSAPGSYLDRVEPEAQPTLLRNLLVIDIDRRRAAGEQPRLEDYLQRFPQFATLIRDLFVDISSVPLTPSGGTPNPRIAAAKTVSVSRLGEYRLVGELGRGGMGVVYEAVHRQRGDHVALKTLPSVDGATLHRFKREFRALADVNHANLVGLHTLEADGSQWFFTMDLVEGVDFLRYVRPGGVLDQVRLRAALTQLVTAVLALHGRHILHRDLKPSNVMVTREGHVVVMDFGLALELDGGGPASLSQERIAGTPAYMAPEQAAGARLTAASDWYAVGVMLYEALSGRLPFTGPLLRLLRDKQRLEAPPLPGDATIPEDLAKLCMGMVAREPQRRPDALALARVVAASAQPLAGQPGRGLVGREQHLATLQEAYWTLQRDRQPRTVLISGRSGEGKTALGEHFLALLRQDKGLAVMAGRCYDRESVPFKALDTLIDALSSYLRSLPETEAALLMPDDIGLLARVFPVLQRVEVVAQAGETRVTGLDDQQVRQRAFRALRSLLGRVGRRSAVVWFVDDLQWGDADSAEALFEVLRPPESPPVLFLGTYRSDETEGSAFLTQWKELQRKHAVAFADREVQIGPLTLEECTALVIGHVGKDSESIRRRAAEFALDTRGNPFLLIELVSCFDAEADSFEPLPLHEVLARKLGRLPAEAGRLLEVVAVSGQALSVAEASRTAGHALPAVATLTRMRNERLVRLVGPEESPLVDTYHDRVREMVLGRMEKGAVQGLHRTLAEVIEQGVGGVSADEIAALGTGESQDEPKTIPRVYDLSYHFDAAGENHKAWAYALLAAEQARRQSALEVATQQYAIAKRNAGRMSNAVRFRITEGYGMALMLLGRYEEANEQLDGVIDLAQDAEKKARIDALHGEIAFKQGELNRSIAFCEQGLRRLGTWVPRTWLGLSCGILRETLIQCWHTFLPWHLHRRATNSRLDLTIRLFRRASYPYGFQNVPRLLWVHLSELNRAELLPPTSLLPPTYAWHGMVMSMLGWNSRGFRFSDRAMGMARGFDDVWAYANSCNYTGIGCYASARYEEGLGHLAESIVGFDKVGDLWELNLAHFHKGCCHFALGNLAEAVAEARWTFAASARIGDSRTLCSSYLWARATRGNIPFEELKSFYPCRPDDIMSTVHGVMAEGHWHSYHGRTEEALQAFERAGQLVRKSHCLNAHTILALPMLASALRLHADTAGRSAALHGDQLRRRAYRLAVWCARITRFFPAAYPLSLRELSLMLAAQGKLRKALKRADESCAVAERQKARYEHAQSLLVRGKIARQLGRPEAEEQIRRAEAALDAIERPLVATAPTSTKPTL
jgi:tetratricopeptide (TPR) repeat protein